MPWPSDKENFTFVENAKYVKKGPPKFQGRVVIEKKEKSEKLTYEERKFQRQEKNALIGPATREHFKFASGAPIDQPPVPTASSKVAHRANEHSNAPGVKRSRTSSADAGNTASEERTGLAAEPRLKHFEKHIIELIEGEIMTNTAETDWEQIVGQDAVKKALKEIVVYPLIRSDIFTRGRAPPRGVLLFGPPGTGKTMLGRCVASQAKATFFACSAASFTSKWVGEGEKIVRALFAVARLKLPAIIFIDEIDSILNSRSTSEHESSRRIKTEFLVQLDGIATSAEERLLVIGATNRPHELDDAARRRFVKRLYVGLPDEAARKGMVATVLREESHSLSAEHMTTVAGLTEGYSGADMKYLCTEALYEPIREIICNPDLDILTIPKEEIRAVAIRDFEKVAQNVSSTVAVEDLVRYEAWNKQYGYHRD